MPWKVILRRSQGNNFQMVYIFPEALSRQEITVLSLSNTPKCNHSVTSAPWLYNAANYSHSAIVVSLKRDGDESDYSYSYSRWMSTRARNYMYK